MQMVLKVFSWKTENSYTTLSQYLFRGFLADFVGMVFNVGHTTANLPSNAILHEHFDFSLHLAALSSESERARVCIF